MKIANTIYYEILEIERTYELAIYNSFLDFIQH